MEATETHHLIDNEPSWITISDALDLFQMHFGSVRANRGDDLIRLFHLPLKTTLEQLGISTFLIIETI